jgi:hypothetical protein
MLVVILYLVSFTISNLFFSVHVSGNCNVSFARVDKGYRFREQYVGYLMVVKYLILNYLAFSVYVYL